MELLKLIIVLEFSIIFGSGRELHCSDQEYALLGENITIDCRLGNVGDVYWYSEKTFFASPIVKLENGKKTISEAAEEHYDISDVGALIVKDITQQQYDNYKIVRITTGKPTEEASLELRQAITPKQHQCPVISQCISCHCSDLDSKQFHNITCSVQNARPQVKLNLITEDKGRFNVTFRGEIFHHDEETDTYDTYVYVVYSLPDCGSSIKVQCVVTGNVFTIAESSVNISAEPCSLSTAESATDQNTTFWNNHMNPLTIIIVVAGVLVLLIVAFAVCFITKQRKAKSKPYSSVHQDDIDNLVSHLANHYKHEGNIQPLPWGDSFPVDAFYTASQFKVTQPNQVTREISSDAFLTEEPYISEPLVLILAELGFGKSTFLKYVSYLWSKKDTNKQKEELLFMISLSGLHSTCDIAEAIVKQLNVDITPLSITNILRSHKCLIIIDGLDEMLMEDKPSNENTSLIGNYTTIENILKGQRLNSKARIWVTSRPYEYSKDNLSPLFLKIELNGFTKEQIITYVKKCCVHYETRIIKQDENLANKNIENEVSTILESNDIVTDFKNSPLLLVMLIHIITSRVCGIQSVGANINIDMLSTLIAAVFTCLEKRYYLKKTSAKSSAVKTLKEKLGELAVSQVDTTQINISELKKQVSCEDIQILLSIGLIRPSTAYTTDFSAHEVGQLVSSPVPRYEFYHEFIQLCLVAMYICQNPFEVNTFLKVPVDKKRGKILNFICGFDKKLEIDILRHLIKTSNWNYFIDCVYESRNYVDEKVVSNLVTKREDILPSPVFTDMSRKYRQEAYRYFCQVSNTNDIIFKRIIFRTDGTLKLFINLPVVTAEQITFDNGKCTDEETFLDVLKWASKHKRIKNIQFVQCEVPESISNKQNIPKTFKVYKGERLEDLSVWLNSTERYILNQVTGKWDRYTMTGIKQNTSL